MGKDDFEAGIDPLTGGKLVAPVGKRMKFADQLHIKSALKNMRKAHTKPNRAERERDALLKAHQAPVNLHGGIEFIKTKTVEQIAADVKSGFNSLKDQRKRAKESKKVGVPRLIMPELIEEIKTEMKESRMRARIASARRSAAACSAENGDTYNGTGTNSSLDRKSRPLRPVSAGARMSSSTSTTRSQKRDRITTATISATTTAVDYSDTEPDIYTDTGATTGITAGTDTTYLFHRVKVTDEMLSNDNLTNGQHDDNVPSVSSGAGLSHNQHHQNQHKQSDLVTNRRSSSPTPRPRSARPTSSRNSVSGSNCNNNYKSNRATSPITTGASAVRDDGAHDMTKLESTIYPRSLVVTSPFRRRATEGDARIERVIQNRNNLHLRKDAELREKIHIREQEALAKQLEEERQERVQSWLVFASALSRVRIWTERIRTRREDFMKGMAQSKQKKAVLKIEKWWFVHSILLKMHRNRVHIEAMRRIFVRFNFKLQYARKNKAADMILNFLLDSTGISETMRRVYAFRQTIIKLQRFIRAYLDIQRCRVRTLWLAAERATKKLAKRDQLRLIREEKEAELAAMDTRGVGDNVYKINSIRKKLNKVLAVQEAAHQKRVRRQEYENHMSELHLQIAKEQHAQRRAEHAKEKKEAAAAHQQQHIAISSSSRQQFPKEAIWGDTDKMDYRNSSNVGGHNRTGAGEGGMGMGVLRKGEAGMAAVVDNIGGGGGGGSGLFSGSTSKSMLSITELLMQNKQQREQEIKHQHQHQHESIEHEHMTPDELAKERRRQYLEKKRQIPWHIRMCSNAQNKHNYAALRHLLGAQRKRHILAIQNKEWANIRERQKTDSAIDVNILKKFLKDPKENEMSLRISQKLVDIKPVSSKVSTAHDSPFLMLTHGGLQAVEALLIRDKTVKFHVSS